MREESHLDDMRSAIRGDFERLAERRGGQELMREPELEPEAPPDDEQHVAAHESEPEPEPEPVELAPEPEPVELAPEPDVEPEVAVEEPPPAAAETPLEEPRRRSFLDRLLGR
jgi:hypothetical protein